MRLFWQRFGRRQGRKTKQYAIGRDRRLSKIYPVSGGEESSTGDDPGDDDGDDSDDNQDDDADDDENNGDEDSDEFTAAQQKRVDALMARTRKEAAARTAERLKKEREEAEAEKQGEYEKLAVERKQRISELEPELEETQQVRDAAVERVEELEKRLAAIIEPQVEALPEYVRALLEDKSPDEVADWLSANQDKLNGESSDANEDTGKRKVAGSKTPEGGTKTSKRTNKDVLNQYLRRKRGGDKSDD